MGENKLLRKVDEYAAELQDKSEDELADTFVELLEIDKKVTYGDCISPDAVPGLEGIREKGITALALLTERMGNFRNAREYLMERM